VTDIRIDDRGWGAILVSHRVSQKPGAVQRRPRLPNAWRSAPLYVTIFGLISEQSSISQITAIDESSSDLTVSTGPVNPLYNLIEGR
jgi:hypothetical protein